MPTDVVEAPAEVVDLALGQDDGECAAEAAYTYKVWRIPVWRTRRENCKRRAAGLILVTCPQHGPKYMPLCSKHLRELHTKKPTIRCGKCDSIATWRDDVG